MILRNYIHIQPQFFSPDDLAQISTCANNHELMDAKVGNLQLVMMQMVRLKTRLEVLR